MREVGLCLCPYGRCGSVSMSSDALGPGEYGCAEEKGGPGRGR